MMVIVSCCTTIYSVIVQNSQGTFKMTACIDLSTVCYCLLKFKKKNMDEFTKIDSISASEDEDDDEWKHVKMLEAINSLDGKKRRKIINRTEPSTTISEFNLAEGKGKVKLHELVASLKQTPSHSAIKKQLSSTIRRRKVLPVPLNTEEAQKISRKIAYDKISREVSRWNSVVKANREADQLIFPLQRPDISIRPASEYVKKFQPKTPMEIEISKLLNANSDVLSDKPVLTSAEEEAEQALNVINVKKSLRELQKARALLSYAESKYRRQNKIKSKKYHRILKKERLQKEMKEFEKLKQENPVEAAEKLKELEKLRILERMTLKHKNTGKWAKHKLLSAKYNKESRDAISEQLELSRQLTQKIIVDDDSDDDKLSFGMNKNENGDIQNGYKNQDDDNVYETENNENQESLMDETLERKTTMQDFDNMEKMPMEDKSEWFKRPSRTISDITSEKNKFDTKSSNEISFEESEINVVNLNSQRVECEAVVEEEELDALSDDGGNKRVLSESYWDSEIIKEFKAKKSAIVEKEKPKNISTYLPGWGDWGGSGIKVSKRKKRRFCIKAPPAPPRKDSTLGNVIINEKHDEKLKQFQVSELPFPFSNIEQYESTLQHPIGSTWNPESAFQRAIAPKVVTKMGQIIEPIDSEALLKKKEENEDKLEFELKNKRKGVTQKKNVYSEV